MASPAVFAVFTDIDKESLARLPLLQRSDLDDKGKRAYDSPPAPRATAALCADRWDSRSTIRR